MRSLSQLSVLVITAAALAACSEPAGPVPGAPRAGVLQVTGHAEASQTAEQDDGVHWTVDPDDDTVLPPRVLAAPDTVSAGVPFEVTVTTIGPNACWGAESQEVSVDAGTVELLPFDAHTGADACGEVLLHLSHTSTLTLDTPGEWVIRVTGRRVRMGDATWEEPVSAEKVVVVR